MSSASTALETQLPASASLNKRRWIWGPIGVIRQEIRRTLTVGRIFTWLAMAFFPPFLIGIVAWQLGANSRLSAAEINFGYTFLMFVLVPQVMTVLGMLLWATPIVHSELEAQTWVYAVVRPGARRAVLLGKYCVAVLWTFSCSAVALSLAVPLTPLSQPLWTWSVLCMLSLFAAIAYAALFVTIGTLIQKRPMVVSFLYAFFIEAIASTLPATINQLTISHRLRAIMAQSLQMDVSLMDELPHIFDISTSLYVHLACLGAFTSVLMSLVLWRVQAGQYVWQSEV